MFPLKWMAAAMAVAIAGGSLVPYSETLGDQYIPFSEDATASTLTDPFVFCGQPHSELFVSPNGAVSFGERLPADVVSLNGRDAIAVYYLKAKDANLYFKIQHGDSTTGKELRSKLSSAFGSSVRDFRPTEVAVITWEDVKGVGVGAQANGMNTFQLGLLTNGTDSYAILIYSKLDFAFSAQRYPDIGFYCSSGRNLAGFNNGTEAAAQLATLSLGDEKGVYAYRTTVEPEQNRPDSDTYEYSEADTSEYEEEEDEQRTPCPEDEFGENCPRECNVVPDSRGCRKCICANAKRDADYSEQQSNQLTPPDELPSDSAQRNPIVLPPVSSASQGCNPSDANDPDLDVCHINANCEVQQSGYCCVCSEGYYGNGRNCVQKGKHIRVIGKFEATINGQSTEDKDFHAFVDLAAGQQHIQIVGVDSSIGWTLQALDPIGNVMDWLFAKVGSTNVQNGFQYTGGVFNRSLNIHLGETNAITIRQEFLGFDGDNLRANIIVRGTLPQLQPNAAVKFTDYEERYNRDAAGFLRAYSDRHLTVRQGEHEVQHRVTVDQQIRFVECPSAKPSAPVINRVSRASASYDAAKQMLVFNSQSAAYNEEDAREIAEKANNPCVANYHVCSQPNMYCQPEHGHYRCQCEAGYQYLNDDTVEAKFRCVDTDECARHLCDRNADCTNLPGSYECHCRPGFVGNGSHCERDGESPVDEEGCRTHYDCHYYGECKMTIGSNRGVCQCRGYYVGDGLNHCGPPNTTVGASVASAHHCNQQICDVHAECLQNQQKGGLECVCKVGFEGNGLSCVSLMRPSADDHLHETKCQGDGQCGANARCTYSHHHGYHKCECVAPYTGDGVTCTVNYHTRPAVETCEKRLGCHENAQCVSTGEGGEHSAICQCRAGFEGDGLNCFVPSGTEAPAARLPTDEEDIEEEGRFECNDATECLGQTAFCDLDVEQNRHFCKCLPGFRGDGKISCVKSEECDVRNPYSCSENAKCVFDRTAETYVCQCNEGFSRHGQHCIAAQPPTPPRCDCDPNGGICTEDGRCVCRAGFVGDGHRCQPAASCLTEPTLCSEHAECVPDVRGLYVCNCRYGYYGNGHTCHASNSHRDSTLLVARGMSILQKTTAVDEPGKQLVAIPHQVVVDIKLDCASERIYWSDIAGATIRSATLNGTDMRELTNLGLRSPEGVAIDAASRNLYYVDSIKDQIGVVTLDGKYQKALLATGLTNPRALALDPKGRHLYYSDWYRRNPRIGRINLDGTDNIDFVTDNIELPNGLTILPNRQELCWVDAGKKELSCIRFDRTGRRTVYKPLEYPFGLTHKNEEYFYWTDWKDHQVHAVSVHGAGYHKFIPAVAAKGKVYGVLSLSQKCNDPQSECATNNGGCKYICLPTTPHGAKCECPENVDADDC